MDIESRTKRTEGPVLVRTFLIADVRGYTTFTRRHGDEFAARLAKKFADLARDAVESRGGEVIELRGDEALAVFTSTEQAVRTAIDFQETCREETADDPSLPLPVGIGIDAGKAVPVEDGFRGRALNTAARLCSRAAAGEVFVTRGVADLCLGIAGIRFEEHGSVELKGYDEPVELLEAVGLPRAARSSIPAPSSEALPVELDTSGPLVGREHEMRWLRGTWRRARRGDGTVLFVSGAAGVGKTRLIAELADLILESDRTVRYVGAGGVGPGLAVSAILGANSAEYPCLVVVDDLDTLGEPVVEALREASEAIAERPVLIVAAFRNSEGNPALAQLIEDEYVRGDSHRSLDPLDAAAVKEIARVYAGSEAEDAPVETMLRASGGIPARIHEVVSEWARDEAKRRLAAAAEWLAEGRNRQAAELEFANNVIALRLGRLYAAQTGEVAAADICPYKGLASFEEADASNFFGRERLVGELAARTVGSGLLGVVGPSGSGKSSVVLAGLLPSLSAGLLPGSERWRHVVVRPGEHPVRALATALEGAGGARVVVVDQFEEVFTTAGEDERDAFVQELIGLSGNPEDAVVILTIRADYYGNCAAYPELESMLAANHVIVGPMSPDELKRAIEMPARRVRLRVESSLSDALVGEVADEPGGLPLLSTTLVELWLDRQNGWLRKETYERIGGVRGAVARLAEASFGQLQSEQREAARSILLRLVGQGEADAAVRRRVPLSEFDRTSAVEAVLARFTEDRLLTMSDGMVEVAHEALIREWPRLRSWLEEDIQGQQIRRHITQAAKTWDDRGRDNAELYRGARLSATNDWAARHGRELNELEREFLSEGRRASEQDAERQRRVNRRLRGLLAGVAVFLIVAIVAGSLALVQRSRARASAARAEEAATVSLANTLGADGINQPRLDRGLLLAREAMNLHVSDQTKSNLLSTVLRNPQQVGAIYFGDTGKRPQHIALSPDGKILAVSFNEIDVGFYDASTLKQLALIPNYGGPISPLTFANRSPMFATLGNEHADVRLIDIRTFALGRWIRFHDEYSNPNYHFHLTGLFFSPDDRTLWWGLEAWPPNVYSTSARPRSVIESYSVATGRLTTHVVVDHDWQLGFAPIAGGSRVAVVDGRAAFVYDARTARLIQRIPLHGFDEGDLQLPVALSPDGRTMAIGRADGSVDFVSLASGRTSAAVGGHSGSVVNLKFTPDGSRLVTVGNDDRVVVWDVGSRSVDQTLLGHGGAVHGVATDGRTLYTSSLDGTVFAWDLSQTRSFGQRFAASAGDELGDPVDAPAPYFALSPDGRTLAAPEADGRVILWDMSSSPPRRVREIDAVAPGGIPSIAFSPDGTTLLAGDLHGDVVVDNVSTGARRTLSGFRNPVAAVAFSPDGHLVAATDQYCFPCSGHLALWNVATGALVHPIMKLPGFGDDIAFSPDGSILAVPVGGPTDIIDTRTWKVLHQVRLDADTYAAFSPNGRLLATTGGSGLVRLWETGKWKELGQPFQISAGGGISLSFDPTGHLLATAGTDATARIFDVSEPERPTPFGPPTLPPTSGWTSIRFTPDGSSLVVLDETGQAWVWPMRWQDWAAHACAVAGRQLSRVEWAEFLGGRLYAPVCPRADGH